MTTGYEWTCPNCSERITSLIRLPDLGVQLPMTMLDSIIETAEMALAVGNRHGTPEQYLASAQALAALYDWREVRLSARPGG